MSMARTSGAFADAPPVAKKKQDAARGSYEVGAEEKGLHWPASVSQVDMLGMIDGLVNKILPMCILDGDDASRALAHLRSFRKAASNCIPHGHSYLVAHGMEIKRLLNALLPEIFGNKVPAKAAQPEPVSAEPVFEGARLERLAMAVFPDAKRLAAGFHPWWIGSWLEVGKG